MILRPGVMHQLIIFVGGIGVLAEIVVLYVGSKVHFWSSKMLTDNKFPLNVCALRVIVLELLRGFVDNATSFDELQQYILGEYLCRTLDEKSYMAVFLIMLFICAERGRGFPLHFYACKKVLPYFFSAGHANYARYVFTLLCL